ncbi:unknown [Methanothermobacter thermautotrophicus str. Delta H]|uniref:Uncharacterized protein n=2 Tax=Methanothermobacter thermautotrophicus TaxID=145262 RepID=O26163_METTH|nr:unknown [Methanothermobacter thermautotrophicus str. Delta H]
MSITIHPIITQVVIIKTYMLVRSLFLMIKLKGGEKGMERQYFMVFMVLLVAVALTGSVSAADTNCEVGVDVKYEYADDNGNINPDIQELTDENGTKINFTRTFDPAANMTKIKFNYQRTSQTPQNSQ